MIVNYEWVQQKKREQKNLKLIIFFKNKIFAIFTWPIPNWIFFFISTIYITYIDKFGYLLYNINTELQSLQKKKTLLSGQFLLC